MKFTRKRRLPKCKHRELKDYSIRFKGYHAYRKCNICGRVAENPIEKQQAKHYENAPQNWGLGINPLKWIKNITTDDIEIFFKGTYDELKEDIECYYIARYDRDICVSEQFIAPKKLMRLCINHVRHQRTNYEKLLKHYNRNRDPAIYHHVKDVVNQAIREKLPYLNHTE